MVRKIILSLVSGFSLCILLQFLFFLSMQQFPGNCLVIAAIGQTMDEGEIALVVCPEV